MFCLFITLSVLCVSFLKKHNLFFEGGTFDRSAGNWLFN